MLLWLCNHSTHTIHLMTLHNIYVYVSGYLYNLSKINKGLIVRLHGDCMKYVELMSVHVTEKSTCASETV